MHMSPMLADPSAQVKVSTFRHQAESLGHSIYIILDKSNAITPILFVSTVHTSE